MDASLFLDEFRPFRRGELALTRKLLEDPLFLAPRSTDLLRYALRLAQLSTIGERRDSLVYPIGSFRLRLLQLLAPVLPTDTARMDAAELHELIPRVVRLVDDARRVVVERGLAAEKDLDLEIAHKKLVLVMGGAAGSGYAFLGALERLHQLGLRPDYLVGCSIGSILGVVRARTREFDLEEVYDELRRVRNVGVFRVPNPSSRYGLPAALRLDLRRALGPLFEASDGEQLRLDELAIPTDVLATGLGPGALLGPPEEFAHLVDVRDADSLTRLRPGAAARVVGRLVALAMSRRVLVPLFFGSAPETRELAALDAAGFSAAIPGLLHYDLPPDDKRGAAVLDREFQRHSLLGLVDGGLTSAIPAGYAWEQVETGRLGSRHAVILALDTITRAGGANALAAPLLRTITASVQRDRAFWDLHAVFRRAPPLFELFPRESRLRRACEQGEVEFEPTARLLQGLVAPLPPWPVLAKPGSGAF